MEGDTMFRNGRLAVRSTVTAGLAGLAMLTAAPALVVAGAAAAPAMASVAKTAPTWKVPAAAGSFKRWANAQKAAGFSLYVPKKTGGLKRTNNILVSRCTSVTKIRYQVYASWGAKATFLALDQTNAGQPCGDFGDATHIRNYSVSGVTYKLYGFCGRRGQPSCSSAKASLVMIWKKAGRDYQAYSHNKTAATLLTFATSIKKF
jgi:hypothetical protein